MLCKGRDSLFQQHRHQSLHTVDGRLLAAVVDLQISHGDLASAADLQRLGSGTGRHSFRLCELWMETRIIAAIIGAR
jgi:hypothetical protein